MTLASLGLSPETIAACAALGEPSLEPARCISSSARHALVAMASGEALHHLAPAVLVESRGRPVAGDYLAVDPTPGIVRAVLPRKSELVRQAAGRRAVAQVLAANLDVAFVLTSLDGDFNVRRVERYLSLIRPSGARAVVLLTKAAAAVGLDVDAATAAMREVAPDLPVIAIDVVAGVRAEAPWDHFAPGETAALLGSSGVGKSTLANFLLGSERHATGEVRARDAKGRHTTTRRELTFLDGDRALIDTPGLREIQLWDDEQGVVETFPEIEALAEACRFRDCRHGGEPGCAVLAAIERGEVAKARLVSFQALGLETTQQRDRIAEAERKSAGRQGARALRETLKQKRR